MKILANQGIKITNIALQLFASWDDISTNHAKDLEGANLGDSVKTLSEKLGTLGYDVLFNNKSKAEFVPVGRLHEVSGQRDQFKGQVEDLNKQLQTMKDAAKGNDQLQGQLQQLMDTNTKLLGDLEKTKVNTALMLSATDAVNPQDLLMFVNYENVKLNTKGEVMGAEAEITRLKAEKPYLFQGTQKPGKGGSDPNADKGDPKTSGMNAMIRRQAGRI